MKRWILWYKENKERAEGYLRNTIYRLLDNSDDFLKSGMPCSVLSRILKSGLTGWDIFSAPYITAVDIWSRSGKISAPTLF
ncbi:MAG: hypothetical protein E7309_05020 [Butyrivibrio sp.]|jgi:hypothetical protein|nr:hypothetical protein [Butyrivibrio sp.]